MLFVVPKELVHELTCHTDSVDSCEKPNGLHIGIIHHHCDILQVFESPFEPADQLSMLTSAAEVSDLYINYIPSFSLTEVCLFSNRGPPAIL